RHSSGGYIKGLSYIVMVIILMSTIVVKTLSTTVMNNHMVNIIAVVVIIVIVILCVFSMNIFTIEVVIVKIVIMGGNSIIEMNKVEKKIVTMKNLSRISASIQTVTKINATTIKIVKKISRKILAHESTCRAGNKLRFYRR